MTNNPIKNQDISPRSQEQQKKIVVSIVLSESTASQLKLNIPYVEDFQGESSSQTVGPYMKRTVSSVYNLSKLFESDGVLKNRRILTDTAYFSSKTGDSSSSVESNDDAEIINNGSSDEKLKPVEVLTRPLLSVNSAAHQGHIRCKRNNIYISVLDRKVRSFPSFDIRNRWF